MGVNNSTPTPQGAAAAQQWEDFNAAYEKKYGANPLNGQGDTTDTAEKSARVREWLAARDAARKDAGQRTALLQDYYGKATGDSTDVMLREAGTGTLRKARGGSSRNSFLGSAFDPSKPLGRDSILGDF